MSGKLTIFIMSADGSPVKRLAISKFFIFFLVTLFLSFCAVVGMGGYDYYQLRRKTVQMSELHQKISVQEGTLSVQRGQLQEFAKEINNLKTDLLALNGFEKQIRIIANLDKSESSSGLFGVGGSIPNDLETGKDLKEKHSSLIRAMHGQVEQLDMAADLQKNGFESLLKELDEKKNLLAHTPAIRPTQGILTSGFGNRKSPFTNYSEFHKGIDIAAKIGTPVYATADGKVTFADAKGSFGKMIIINHGHGITTRFAHLNKIFIKAGQAVKRGEKVAEIGNTGRSTGPHLHYEVRLNNAPMDPMDYILN